MKKFMSHDGTEWRVDVALPGSSNAMVIFRHPDGRTSRRDRYNWFISSAPEARSVTSRLSPARVLDVLDDRTLELLFRRSMPVSRPAIEPNLSLGLGGGAAGLSKGIGSVKESVTNDPDEP